MNCLSPPVSEDIESREEIAVVTEHVETAQWVKFELHSSSEIVKHIGFLFYIPETDDRRYRLGLKIRKHFYFQIKRNQRGDPGEHGGVGDCCCCSLLHQETNHPEASGGWKCCVWVSDWGEPQTTHHLEEEWSPTHYRIQVSHTCAQVFTVLTWKPFYLTCEWAVKSPNSRTKVLK